MMYRYTNSVLVCFKMDMRLWWFEVVKKKLLQLDCGK